MEYLGEGRKVEDDVFGVPNGLDEYCFGLVIDSLFEGFGSGFCDPFNANCELFESYF